MVIERVFVVVDDKNDVQWIPSLFHMKSRYFLEDTEYLRSAVRQHNRDCPDDRWKIAECRLHLVTKFDVSDEESELP